MNIVDYVIIGIIGISVLFGLYRGFIASVLNMGCGLMSFLASFWVSPKLAAAVQSNQSFLNMLLHYTDASSRIGDLETAIMNVATLTSQSINSILEKVNLPAPLDTLLRVNLENNVYASSGLSTVSDYVSQTILQENFTMVMLADLENCSLSFTELTEKLSALGAEMDIAIRMQREDIFNAMHKI